MSQFTSVLYVEDNFENRVLVRRLLQHQGLNVMEAETAKQAIHILSENRPDLILLDINLPEMDGYSLTQIIKAMPAMKGIPIVALTANVMRGDRERTLSAGCDGYIEKPIDVDHFIDQIDAFLGKDQGNPQ